MKTNEEYRRLEQQLAERDRRIEYLELCHSEAEQQLAERDAEIDRLNEQYLLFAANGYAYRDECIAKDKQIVMLREALIDVYNNGLWKDRELADEALAATQDLSGLVLCDAVPASYLYQHRSSYTGEFIWSSKPTYNGDQAIATLPLYKERTPK